jgi:hypothetical protein
LWNKEGKRKRNKKIFCAAIYRVLREEFHDNLFCLRHGEDKGQRGHEQHAGRNKKVVEVRYFLGVRGLKEKAPLR